MGWSLTTIASGSLDSLVVLGSMRFLLGMFQAAIDPSLYSLIADYFPVNRISTANSILTSGLYLGSGLSSLSIIAFKEWGWRATLNYMGACGVGLGAFSYFFVKEPRRGAMKKKVETKPTPWVSDHDDRVRFETKNAQAPSSEQSMLMNFIFALWSNMQDPILRFITLGGCFRCCISFMNEYYTPAFFLLKFPKY